MSGQNLPVTPNAAPPRMPGSNCKRRKKTIMTLRSEPKLAPLPTVEHLVQVDMPDGEQIVFWPHNEQDRNEAIAHLCQFDGLSYTVRSKDVPYATETGLVYEWRTIAARGCYAETD
jgi:hypothetical protein